MFLFLLPTFDGFKATNLAQTLKNNLLEMTDISAVEEETPVSKA